MSDINVQPIEDLPMQLTGFKVGDDYYAISVLEVQEVVKPQKVTPVPLASDHIRGLINLRGQIVTSLSLRKLFGMEENLGQDHMNVIVNRDESLFALVVDEILDVIDVTQLNLEKVPENLDPEMKRYAKGIYKLSDKLIVLLDLDKLITQEGKTED